jgi:hypothetical protein
MPDRKNGERLERWQAELEAQERQRAALALPGDPEGLSSSQHPSPDAVEFAAAIAAALESGMSPAVVARSARLELVLGTLESNAPSAFERWAAVANGVPDPPLVAAGRCPLAPAAFLAAAEAAVTNELYGMRFVDARELADASLLHIYEIAGSWDGQTRPFRDRVRTYASIKSLALVVEPEGEGGSRFEILADTRRSARLYGASLIGTAIVLGSGLSRGPQGTPRPRAFSRAQDGRGGMTDGSQTNPMV